MTTLIFYGMQGERVEVSADLPGDKALAAKITVDGATGPVDLYASVRGCERAVVGPEEHVLGES